MRQAKNNNNKIEQNRLLYYIVNVVDCQPTD